MPQQKTEFHTNVLFVNLKKPMRSNVAASILFEMRCACLHYFIHRFLWNTSKLFPRLPFSVEPWKFCHCDFEMNPGEIILSLNNIPHIPGALNPKLNCGIHFKGLQSVLQKATNTKAPLSGTYIKTNNHKTLLWKRSNHIKSMKWQKHWNETVLELTFRAEHFSSFCFYKKVIFFSFLVGISTHFIFHKSTCWKLSEKKGTENGIACSFGSWIFEATGRGYGYTKEEHINIGNHKTCAQMEHTNIFRQVCRMMNIYTIRH